MHEVLHQYAEEQLQQYPLDMQQMRTAHSRYYLTLVAAKQAIIDSSDAAQGVAALQAEFDNIRAGWQWAVTSGDVAALHPCIPPLLRYFVLTGQAVEGGNFADEALQKAAMWLDLWTDTEPAKTLSIQQFCADLHAMRARIYFKQARYAAAIDHAEQALLFAEQCHAPRTAALANLYWGIALVNQGDYGVAAEKLTKRPTTGTGDWLAQSRK
ncbi:MAG: hypothetical protein R2867_31470 [Caldilineaceae bacterium]